ncbi:MAG: hypothetical protein A3J47_00150 [Candidatus Yanofskybacteria bacterium RIFCSPHIGHO2_02_FULL_43_22]|uniref:Heat-inducible transcription repressor HrcA n=1 Tax=Candidatus Yanofskybacteria bacterium RIFCSPHIGHO2_02_FULL_43_22 TaxID=1802681 RepID=A0A1F8FRY4_9BACT|nr:MAG: hypothetical protein A3J47_00150 [Candidatus Yanofskybacteria bacterium RIFCSPHIGHO2_02_FULL_43_22]
MITDRQEKLLNFIIKEYVKTAKPVGSALVAKKGDFCLGPASLRSEMCELEQAGYLSHLHTSGGRVPTDKAYRYFVNNLIRHEDFEPAANEKRKIRTVISSAEDPRRLNKNIAQMLSELSDNVVITKIMDDPDFYKVGLASLFEFPEFREMNRIFEVTNLFDRFETIFDKIEKHFFSQLEDEFQLFIGNENPLGHIKDETMILAKYSLPDGLRGSLTMIGPTRMNYERNISLVKYTTDELNKLADTI